MSPFEKISGHRYLVIARAGEHSLHRQWLEPAAYKNFDLCLSYYGDEPRRYAADCDFYFEEKGTKWPKIYELMQAFGEQIMQYDAIWFPDDDIQTNAINIHQMFQLFTEQQLLLAQPALTKNAYFQVTAQHIDYELRYTQFVEIMVPLFSSDALRTCWPSFNKNITGWGLEHVWAKLLKYPNKKIAILDKTPVKHTRPTGLGDLYTNIKTLFQTDVSFIHEVQILAEYGIALPTEEIGFYDGIKKWKLPAVSSSVRSKHGRKKRKKNPIVSRKKRALIKKIALKKAVLKKAVKSAMKLTVIKHTSKKILVNRKAALKKSA